MDDCVVTVIVLLLSQVRTAPRVARLITQQKFMLGSIDIYANQFTQVVRCIVPRRRLSGAVNETLIGYPSHISDASVSTFHKKATDNFFCLRPQDR